MTLVAVSRPFQAIESKLDILPPNISNILSAIPLSTARVRNLCDAMSEIDVPREARIVRVLCYAVGDAVHTSKGTRRVFSMLKVGGVEYEQMKCVKSPAVKRLGYCIAPDNRKEPL